MKPQDSDLTVTIRAKDEVTPVIRHIQRQLFWLGDGPLIMAWVVGALLFASGLLVGLLVR